VVQVEVKENKNNIIIDMTTIIFPQFGAEITRKNDFS